MHQSPEQSAPPFLTDLTKGTKHVMRLALLASVGLPIFLMVAALGTRFGLWSWLIGFGLLSVQIGSLWIWVSVILAFCALYSFLVARPAKSGMMLAIIFLVPMVALGVAGVTKGKAEKLPPIHDIATDMTVELMPSEAMMAARGHASNPILVAKDDFLPFDRNNLGPFNGRSRADVQAAAYPNIAPLNMAGTNADAVLEKVLAEAAKRHWVILGQTKTDTGHRVEANVRSFWYGFTDDIIIDIVNDGKGGALINMRSISRVGRSDLGVNAARIEAFWAALKG